jgi:hypothetical protein
VKTDDRPDVGRAEAENKNASLVSSGLTLLASVKFAVTVIVIIAAACVVGTILPQGTDAAAYIQDHPAAASRFAFLDRLGITHIFSARWFIALLCVLAASIMVCSTRRLATVKRASGFAQRRALGSMLTHISILLILAGAVVRGVWGEKGYIELRKGEAVASFQADRGPRPLPFELHLTKFEIETDPAAEAARETAEKNSPTLIVHWSGREAHSIVSAIEGTDADLAPENEVRSPQNTFHIQVLRYVPDFTVDTTTHEVTSRSTEPNNPAVLVAVNGPGYQNHRWVFAKFPDFAMHEDGSPVKASPFNLTYRNEGAAVAPPRGALKNFRSTFDVVANGQLLGERTAAVNHPLKLNGYTFYQSGYNPNDLSWTSLEVVRDPGVPLVYAGFLFLIGGLFTVFYLNPWLSRKPVAAVVSPAAKPATT